MTPNTRPHILTIAGLDPTGGAGILSDVKTIENIGGYGLSVCTANTLQTDHTFHACNWVANDTLLNQLDMLVKHFNISAVKIGIIKDADVLSQVTDHLASTTPDVPMIWDPVVKASAGFQFHYDSSGFEALLPYFTLVTPNKEEINFIGAGQTEDETIKFITSKTSLLITGGHNDDMLGTDILHVKNSGALKIEAAPGKYFMKHGSGCVLSTAIATYLGKGLQMIDACKMAKKYVERFLASNPSMLGYHIPL